MNVKTSPAQIKPIGPFIAIQPHPVVPTIFIKVCPPTALAKIRVAKLKGLQKKERASAGTRRVATNAGVCGGIKSRAGLK